MKQDFPRLFSPFTLRGVTLRNRIVSTAHGTYMSSGGLANERIGAYHEARARGGVGLIICEAASVHATALGAGRYASAHTDECIVPYRRVVDRIRAHGAAVFGQLYHPGRGDIAGSSDDGSVSVAYAPSALASERNQLTPRPMSLALIREVVGAYGDAAGRMCEAGFQGIEVMAHHGHLVSQFLNPRINRRGDGYGGSASARLRFLREILETVRSRIRDDMPLGVRICADEMDDVGLRPAEALSVCRSLARSGLADYLSINLGSTSSFRGGVHVTAPMAFAPGYIAPHARAIRSAVGLPVLATGRINEPRIAERLLADGAADLCGMTRAQICDPELADKAREGRSAAIRVCIACNQACIGHGAKGAPISCIQYPESGREQTCLPRPRAARRLRVLVAGGGPAGLKAAAVAAECGHRVALFETKERLGGQVLIAARLPGRSEFAGLAANLAGEARRAGVEIVTGQALTRALVEERKPDLLVVAAGAKEHRPPAEGDGHVVTAWQVALDEVEVGRRVVVADSRLDWTALGVAEKLARGGCAVRLAVIGDVPGQNVPLGVRSHALGELDTLGVEILPHLKLLGSSGGAARFRHTLSARTVELSGVDTLVVAAGAIQDSTLEGELAGYPGAVRYAGDCLAPRSAEEAVLEGLRAGLIGVETRIVAAVGGRVYGRPVDVAP